MVPVKSFMIPAEQFVVVDRAVSVRRAAEIMKESGIGSVFVTQDKVIIGIVTDTDICRRLVGVGLDPDRTPVEKVMTSPFLKIDENKTIRDANAMMSKEHVRHLGVSREGDLVGIISVRDMVTFVSNLPRKWILGSGGRRILEQIYGRP